jgi:hypothetical protein
MITRCVLLAVLGVAVVQPAGEPGASTKPAATTAATTTAARKFRMGEKLVYKRAASIEDLVTVKRVGKYWIYVGHDGWPDSRDEWVDPAKLTPRPPGTPQPKPWPRPPNHRPEPIPPEPAAPVQSPDAASGRPAVNGLETDAGSATKVDLARPVREADRLSALTRPAATTRPLGTAVPKLNPPESVFTTTTLLSPRPGQTTVVVQHHDAPPGGPEVSKLEWVDLLTGRLLRSMSLPTGNKGLAVDREQTRLAAVEGGAVAVYDLAGQSPRLVTRFFPVTLVNGEMPPGTRVEQALFAGQGRLVVHLSNHSVTAWDLGAADATTAPRAVWTVEGASHAELSSDQAVVFVSGYRSTAALSAADGTVLLNLPEYPGFRPLVAPDGRSMVLLRENRLVRLSLPGLEPMMDVQLVERRGSAQFLADDVIAVGGRLIDLRTGLAFWRYEAHGRATQFVFAGNLYTLFPDPARTVVTRLPDKSAEAALTTLRKRPAAEIYLLTPGQPMGVEVQAGEHTEAVRAEVMKLVTASGHKPAENAALTLTATVSAGESKPITYNLFGRGQQTVTVAEHVCTLRLTRGGEVLWEQTSKLGPPMMIQIKDGQSADQAVAEQRPRPASGFASMLVPARLPNPAALSALNVTTIK